MPTPDHIPKKGSNILARVTAGEAVLALPTQGQIKVLNAVGTRVWELIDGQRTIDELARLVCLEYAVESRRALDDTLAFISDLAGMRIVTLQTADSLRDGVESVSEAPS
jgi:hypothetical protein